MKSDIQNLDDIKHFVNDFYAKVRDDEMIGDIFELVVEDRWPEHLEKMYRFWQTVLLNEHSYKGSPFLPHATLPVEKAHFDRWLALFSETIDTAFMGKNADKAKWQGERMATMFLSKILHYRDNPAQPLL